MVAGFGVNRVGADPMPFLKINQVNENRHASVRHFVRKVAPMRRICPPVPRRTSELAGPSTSGARGFRLPPIRIVACLTAALAAGVAGAESVSVLRDGDVAGWEEKVFKGTTLYETVRQDGRAVIRATSRGTASGLYLRRRIDLEKTPILRWTWRVDGTLGDIDERTRGGDDYSARVYVIRSHPVFLWRTRAVNYVWASSQAAGTTWPNAYTDASQNVAVRSGDAYAGQWVEERRDVRADFLELFGESVRYVDAVAIMTDTDNTGAAAVAYYGDITLSRE